MGTCIAGHHGISGDKAGAVKKKPVGDAGFNTRITDRFFFLVV